MTTWDRSSAKSISRSSHEAKATRAFDITAMLLAGSFCILLVVVLARVAQLQLAPSDSLVTQMKPRTSSRVVLPVRGDI